MGLGDELTWRGFVYQTTYQSLTELEKERPLFYWGVDPSADSLTVGNLAGAMLAKCLIRGGLKAVLVVGGATGLIGDPDGKTAERRLSSYDEIDHNKDALENQIRHLFNGQDVKLVDNYSWFKEFGYLDFLRKIGKQVPQSQMLGRDFVKERLGEGGSGLSYAEYSYVLIQAYDFYHLNKKYDVSLQIAGSDQWGNSIAGVDLIRRLSCKTANVLAMPLLVNQSTGIKFGKTEAGAIWLDPNKTSPTHFYQFWINTPDSDVESYLKIFTALTKAEIEELVEKQNRDPASRPAQTKLAQEVTRLVHSDKDMATASLVTDVLVGNKSIDQADKLIEAIRREISHYRTRPTGSVVDALVGSGLVESNTEARRLLTSGGVAINGQRTSAETFKAADFIKGRLLLRRGKAYKDSALIELD